MKKTVVAVLLLLGLVGCKDSEWQQIESLGSKHRITLYSGGQVVGTWESTGNVSNQASSDGWYFKDEKTGKLIELAGTLVIEQE